MGALICSSGANYARADFLADSGATDHMCHDRGVFDKITECRVIVKLVNGDAVTARGRGTASLRWAEIGRSGYAGCPLCARALLQSPSPSHSFVVICGNRMRVNAKF